MAENALPLLDNRGARKLFLHRHLLGEPPKGSGKGADLAGLVRDLGFVQVDSVNTLARAHDMILYARRPAYRPGNLAPLIERDRLLFEHWTHDAAILPTEFLPHIRHRFQRDANQMRARWPRWQGSAFLEELRKVKDHVAQHGEVCSADLKSEEATKSTGWWDWHPSKAALEFLWRSGELAVSRRQGFRKYYDLSDRVLGPQTEQVPLEESLDWLNNAALERLGFATRGEIAAFWDIATPKESRAWCQAELQAGRLIEAEVECDKGRRRVYLRPGTLESTVTLPDPPKRIRVLSPFDPALRDRKRAERLFGFHYRIEIFVPAPKRSYGYYVFPLLEGDRLVGRIDMKANRESGTLDIARLWPEEGVRFGAGRIARLEAELIRVARFAGLDRLHWGPDWLAASQP
ncbi:winged helix-turn-helix domain-containing protein [Pseudooceanicola sp. HF7]|uniref:winged helix-turn-helix domain-containing protein n=1 Tax=Pseudooceanicola sp. HF7 TaxID=2721560 RepID=UPI001430926E|nr:crosslink repair DNA glycosylase YcaQ family protein [Pseudooceanicola sp. HF7]NIZ09141.1 winged helix-turn-helix domain-containing protein [Pseudooceanicola sp. HF7]